MTPKILFEDKDFLVIDKPSGIVVNNSDTTADTETVQDLVKEKIDTQSEDDEFISRGGIVHRLDKETSGLLLIAKNANTFRTLQSQFKERTVKKEYIALVHGEVLPSEGEISVPVGRLPWNRKRFGVLAGGRESKTLYRTIETGEFEGQKLTLLRLSPFTGRTHQIRVHLKYINHPIFGDYLYAGRKVSKKDRKLLDRVFLHAYQISFLHPQTAKPLSFKAELPEELKDLLNMIKFKWEVI